MDISKSSAQIQDDQSPLSPDFPLADVSQDIPAPVKRKGGRKPVYTTVQERKQRNRMAQAAFRERRTDYIKQLEETLKENEDLIKLLERNSRETTEECHMLRYKTSLLEDLLYENGIDYHSELQSRSSRSLLSSPYPAQSANKQAATSQSSPDAEQPRMHRFPDATERARALKRRSKSSSTNSLNNNINNQSYEPKSESSSVRVATTMMTAFEAPGLMPANFDYPNGTGQSMQPAFDNSRFRFEDPRIDPTMSGGPADPYYSMVHPNVDPVSTEPECESRSNTFNGESHRSSKNGISRAPEFGGSSRHGQHPRRSQGVRSHQHLEQVLHTQQHSSPSTMRDRMPIYDKTGYLLAGAMEIDAVDVLAQNFELSPISID